MSLMSQLKKNSKIKETDILNNSKFFNERYQVPTDIPALNIAFSGRPDGGISSGLIVFAGPSKHFKTAFALVVAAAYMKYYPESTLVFYDSEFGSPKSYFDSFGIDTNRVLHCPIKNVEELKKDLTSQLEMIDNLNKEKKKGESVERIIFIIDSIGNLASKKEVDDALAEKSVADMTRAKAIKSVFRIATPYLQMNDIPMIAVNHTYKEIGLFPKEIVSGGTGIYYSSNTIFIVGRRQQKVGTEVEGYDFILNVEKSRFVKEKSKIPISVTFKGGISQHSGLLDICLALGFMVKPNNGWYQEVDINTGEIIGGKLRLKDVGPTLMKIVKFESFKEQCKKMYQLGTLPMLDYDQDVNVDDVVDVVDDVVGTDED